jgi:hypothetical protein
MKLAMSANTDKVIAKLEERRKQNLDLCPNDTGKAKELIFYWKARAYADAIRIIKEAQDGNP